MDRCGIFQDLVVGLFGSFSWFFEYLFNLLSQEALFILIVGRIYDGRAVFCLCCFLFCVGLMCMICWVCVVFRGV